MIEGYLIEVLVASIGGMVWFLINRVTNKLDEIHGDLVALTVDHGQRITRLEAKAHYHTRKGDSVPASN